MQCSQCSHHKCYLEGQNCTKIKYDEIREAYRDAQNFEIMHAAACTEAQHYNKLTRLEETAEFCKLMKYNKLGVAFCIGMTEEAFFVSRYLSKFFKVHSVCCKVCGFPKSEMGLAHIKEDVRETMCNPLMQARVLNDEKVDFNVTVGLCVGHDSLFNKACDAPVSCLIAKDRVLAHNPAGVVYSRYWKKRLGIQLPGTV